jgi:hypothetical protein
MAPRYVFSVAEEHNLGLRCRGCGQRITSGWTWFGADVGINPMTKEVVKNVVVGRTCNDKACPAYKELSAQAVCRQRLVPTEWLVGEPPEDMAQSEASLKALAGEAQKNGGSILMSQ